MVSRSSDLVEIDGELCALTVIADITERKRADEQLQHLSGEPCGRRTRSKEESRWICTTRLVKTSSLWQPCLVNSGPRFHPVRTRHPKQKMRHSRRRQVAGFRGFRDRPNDCGPVLAVAFVRAGTGILSNRSFSRWHGRTAGRSSM